MKKGKTSSSSKLKCLEKKLNTKSSTNNIKKPDDKKNFPESSSNKKSKDFLKQKIKHSVYRREKKHIRPNLSCSKDNEISKESHKKIKKPYLDNHLLLNINNVNTTNNNNIFNINSTNSNKNINTSQNNLLTNHSNIQNNNINHPNNFNIDEKILLKLHKIKLKYKKKLENDTLEIKSLTEKNDKLEELVCKLKDTLDRANDMFPDFLEQIITTKSEKEKESNRISDIDYNSIKNENSKIKSELNIKISEIKNNLKQISDLNNNIEERKKQEEKNELLIKELKNENESLIIENSGIKNELKHMNEEHDKEKQKNNELNNNLNNIRNNYENKIKIINETNNKELNSKNEEIKKLNEIIIDQEKVINELKDIIHKNNDKIIEYSQKNNNLKEEIDKINWINKSKLEQINKEIEELSKNYVQKVETFNELEKNYISLKTNILNNINNIKENIENKNTKQIQEELNQVNDKINQMLKSENNKEIINEIIKIIELNKEKDSNMTQINKEINNIKERLKIIESFKIKYEEKILYLIRQNEIYKKEKENNINNDSNNITNFTTITKKKGEEEYMTPKNTKIFSEEIMTLDEKSNSKCNISIEDRIVKKINFSEEDKEFDLPLKEELIKKDNIIIQLQQEIKNLELQNSKLINSKNETIEHKTLVDDEEFNELIEENDELKKLNKELMGRLAEITNITGFKQNEIFNNKNKEKIEENEELNSLREKLEEVYRELNQYRIKNSELNSEIKKIKDKNLDDDDEIGRLMEQLKSIEKENNTLKELLKQNNNDLKNKIIV